MSPRYPLCHILWQITLAACTQTFSPDEAGELEVRAKGARIELADSRGRIEIQGDELRIEGAGALMRLNGHAAIKMEGQAQFEAKALTIAFSEEASKLELEGEVEARFKVRDCEEEDAGR